MSFVPVSEGGEGDGVGDGVGEAALYRRTIV
jgi:hypothetical protein